MRELTIRDGGAFWISGYESDRLQLVEAIRRASLPPGDLEYAPAPHVSSLRSDLESHGIFLLIRMKFTTVSSRLLFQMRELTIRDGRAFWITGYEATTSEDLASNGFRGRDEQRVSKEIIGSVGELGSGGLMNLALV